MISSIIIAFIDNMSEDPYPVDIEGQYAAFKDVAAREFDTEDDDEFDKYYDKIDEWNNRHRWHTASSGAILADLYFQMVGEHVEISWNNQDSEDGVNFLNEIGGVSIPKEQFCVIVEDFLKEYAHHSYTCKAYPGIFFSSLDIFSICDEDRDPADHRIEHQKAYAGIEYREYFSYHVHRCIVSYPT